MITVADLPDDVVNAPCEYILTVVTHRHTSDLKIVIQAMNSSLVAGIPYNSCTVITPRGEHCVKMLSHSDTIHHTSVVAVFTDTCSFIRVPQCNSLVGGR